jgi:hypothetical protein
MKIGKYMIDDSLFESLEELQEGADICKSLPKEPIAPSVDELEESSLEFSQQGNEMTICITKSGIKPTYIPLKKYIELVKHIDTTVELQPIKVLEGRKVVIQRQVMVSLESETSSIVITESEEGQMIEADRTNGTIIGKFYIKHDILSEYYMGSVYLLHRQEKVQNLLKTISGGVKNRIVNPLYDKR